MAKLPELQLKHTSLRIADHMLDRYKLGRFLDHYTPPLSGPAIVDFQPWQGYAGTLMLIAGSGFADERNANHVEVDGQPARVIAAEPNLLTVITHHRTRTGSVKVTVNGVTATGPRNFDVLAWPQPSAGGDGPPYSFAGAGGTPSAGSVPSTGTARILVVVCHPTDLVPPNPANTRQIVVDTFAKVTTFYDQASYSQLDVQVDVTAYVALLNDRDYYHRANGAAGYPNIDGAVLDQLMAECAQGAVDQGLDLNDYSVLVASVYMPGYTVRAWGGWSQSNFAYDNGAGVSINITTTNPLGLIAQRHDADWGRAAHEFGHNLVDGALVLGEDVYDSDLIDPSEATAQNFEMMGNHDSHPLFSSFYMHQLGWYDAANIVDLVWDRNPFLHVYDLVAHGLTQDLNPNRYHLLRIKVSDGLYYFVEVRQRPDAAAAAATVQIFDENIPLPMGGALDGGVIVTKVITGELNNNHQTRLITLLQEQTRVMVSGEEAIDQLRTLRIVVEDDNIQSRPRVCRVRIEWAQVIADTPGGDFDLRIEPWGPGWETVDIWVDRSPFGIFDNTDGAGNPVGNGDAPRPLEINRFEARIRNDGMADATNVKVTHYSVEPPGVGDNGNWSPLFTHTIPNIPAAGSEISRASWVPLVGEHTCLKVAISPQLGEITTGNNFAQENVFTFEPAAHSIPEPVVLTVAVRNPLKERSLVMISLQNVPYGYYVYFPHRWIWLEGLAERKLDLLVIPLIEIREMKQRKADIRLFGRVPRVYSEKLDMTGFPGSWMAPIGGILASVVPKYGSIIKLDDKVNSEKKNNVRVTGHTKPIFKDQQIRVDMTLPNGTTVSVLARTDGNGNFAAAFVLDQRGKKLDKPQTKGATYVFQAHIINASQLAPADSNLVWYER